jgi:hypothetical protein
MLKFKGAETLILYGDNCPATNKNNYILNYLHFLVHSQKLFNEIVICYMIPGHTKFSVDRAFGIAKNKLKNYSDDLENYE